MGEDHKGHVSILERLTQRRTPSHSQNEGLNRCLGIFDLVNSGFSIVVGAGIFVITPVLTANTAGPAVTISYLIAGLAALISALTYAELAGRFEGIGSAYLYVYFVLGELAASVTGVMIIIENMIGLASLIKSLSIYTDQLLFKGAIIAFEKVHFAMDVDFMTDYADLFGLLILLICGALNLWGVKETVVASAICNVVVVISLVIVIVMGFVRGSVSNWFDTIPPEFNVTDPKSTDFGAGGFFPYEISGVLTGASLAYFSYAGFDAIACLGCEAKNPQRDIPVSIIITFGMVMVLYILTCGSITYVAPYYTMANEAGMALAFKSLPWVALTVSLGGVMATATGSFASVLAVSRIVFSMAQDGIVFRAFSYVSSHQVPVVAIAVSIVLPALGILLLDLEELVMMNSGGMLISFCMTNVCVIVVRYQPTKHGGKYGTTETFAILFGMVFWMCSIVSTVCFVKMGHTLQGKIAGGVFLLICVLIVCLISYRFEEVEKASAFKCPLVPWLPALGIYVNSALMVSLPIATWARVGVCVVLGLIGYASYGLRRSTITLAKLGRLSWYNGGINGEEGEDSPLTVVLARKSQCKSPDSFSDQDRLVGNEL